MTDEIGREAAGVALVLLHGLGATAEVWDGVRGRADAAWDGPVHAPELSGHGRAGWAAPYSFGRYAAEVAAGVGTGRAVVVGHSMGGVVALALASGWFGLDVVAAVGIGIKVRWADEELAKAASLSARPVSTFDSREEAVQRYLRVSGLAGLLDLDDPRAAAGVAEDDGGWRLAQDPRTFGVGAPDMAGLLAAARGQVTLAAGAGDPMSPRAHLADLVDDPVTLQGLGHNAHVEDPDAVWSMIARLSP